MKKIIFYINSFYPVFGGAQKQARLLAKELKNKGFDTTILTRKIKGLKKTIDNIRIIGIKIYGSSRITKAISFSFFSILFFIKNRKNFDIIQTFQMDSNSFTAVVVGKLLNKKAIVRIAGAGKLGEISKHNTFFGKIMIKTVINLASGFIVLNKQSYLDIVKLGVKKEKIILLGNGVEIINTPNIDKNMLKKQMNLPNKKICLFSGRFAEPKKLFLLIEVWEKINNDDFFLILCGDGPLKEKLERKITSNNVKNVEITFKNDLKNLYLASDIFILPTESEGMPNSLLEAMSFKCIPLASNVSGVNEIITDSHNGFLFDNTEESLQEKLEYVMKELDKLKPISENAYKTILEKFSIEKISKKYIKFINSL